MAQGDWAGLINTTIAQYIPGVTEKNVFRTRKTWAMARQKGRIFFDGAGRYQDWAVEYKEAPIRPFGAGTNLIYERREYWFRAQLEWRGYSTTDALSLMDTRQNQGQPQLINMMGERVERLTDSMTRHVGDELYTDGTATGNELRFHGLRSFLGYTIDSGTYTFRGATTHRPTALPASFYATKPCTLGGLGGSWTGTWPDGTGDTQYDAWSPMITHYGSDYFSDTPTWVANCVDAMRFHIIYAGRNSEMGETNIDLVTVDRGMFYDWLKKAETQERLVIQPQGGLLWQMGFRGDNVNYMGTDITYEYANPAGEGFSWSFENMRITSLMPQMFTPYGPFQDTDSLGYKWALIVLGNIRCNPRAFGRLVAA